MRRETNVRLFIVLTSNFEIIQDIILIITKGQLLNYFRPLKPPSGSFEFTGSSILKQNYLILQESSFKQYSSVWPQNRPVNELFY